MELTKHPIGNLFSIAEQQWRGFSVDFNYVPYPAREAECLKNLHMGLVKIYHVMDAWTPLTCSKAGASILLTHALYKRHCWRVVDIWT